MKEKFIGAWVHDYREYRGLSGLLVCHFDGLSPIDKF